MRTIAGAILMLAGAVLFAGGVVGDSIIHAANRLGGPPPMIAMLGGALTGLIGLCYLIVGMASRGRE